MTRAERDRLRREPCNSHDVTRMLDALDAADEALERAEAALEAADRMAANVEEGRPATVVRHVASRYRAARAKTRTT